MNITEEENIIYKLVYKVPKSYRDNLKGFLIFRLNEGQSIKTIESYGLDLKQFIEYLSIRNLNIQEVESENIERYKNYLLRKGLKVKSINRKLTSINQFLKFNNNQVKYKKLKEQKQNILNDVLEKEEIEKMIYCCKDNLRDKAIILTLFKMGLRVSELLQLVVSDTKKSKITIKGKGGKYRSIPIPKDVKKAWLEYLDVRTEKKESSLFVGKRGALQRQSINKIIRKYSKKAKIRKEKAHPHSLRHSFCKALVAKGVDPIIIADFAGHSSLETTRIYTRQTERELLNIMEII